MLYIYSHNKKSYVTWGFYMTIGKPHSLSEDLTPEMQNMYCYKPFEGTEVLF